MYIVEFQGNCQTLRDVLSRFSNTFSPVASDWTNFDQALRAYRPAMSPTGLAELVAKMEEKTRKIVRIYEKIELRLPLVTICFREGQGLRFYLTNAEDSIQAHCLLLNSSVEKLIGSLVEGHMDFSGKHSF